MKQQLREKAKEEIRDNQNVSVLYRAIKSCCIAYLTKMRNTMSCTESLLVEVLRILDDIKEDSENADEICSERWYSLQLEYQEMVPEADDEEISNLLSIIIYMTALLLRWYDGKFAVFYHSLAEILCDIVASEQKDFDSYLRPFREKILNHSELLTKWITHYLESDEFLSDEFYNAKYKQLNLPPKLDTPKAQEMFSRAIEKGYMSYSDGEFKWLGVDGSGSNTQLAYLCGLIYNYKYDKNLGNQGDPFPEDELEMLFGIKRLRSSLNQAYQAKNPQEWRSVIESLENPI